MKLVPMAEKRAKDLYKKNNNNNKKKNKKNN